MNFHGDYQDADELKRALDREQVRCIQLKEEVRTRRDSGHKLHDNTAPVISYHAMPFVELIAVCECKTMYAFTFAYWRLQRFYKDLQRWKSKKYDLCPHPLNIFMYGHCACDGCSTERPHCWRSQNRTDKPPPPSPWREWNVKSWESFATLWMIPVIFGFYGVFFGE